MTANFSSSQASQPESCDSSALILLVTNDSRVVRLMAKTLVKAGYQLLKAANGAAAQKQLTSRVVDCVLLDVHLPDVSGYALCADLRKRTLAPILLLATRMSLEERVMGIEVGADGYIIQPFVMPVLKARIATLLERANKARAAVAATTFCIGSLHLDAVTQEVTCQGRPLHMTPEEFQLLHCLMRYPNRWVRKEELVAYLWPYEQNSAGVDDYGRLRVAISRLRKKLETCPDRAAQLISQNGLGYQIQLVQNSPSD